MILNTNIQGKYPKEDSVYNISKINFFIMIENIKFIILTILSA